MFAAMVAATGIDSLDSTYVKPADMTTALIITAIVVTIASVLITVGVMKTAFKGDGAATTATARAKPQDDTRTVTNALYGAYDQGNAPQEGYLDVGRGGDSWDAGQGNANDMYTDAPTWGGNNAPSESSFKRAGFQKDGDNSFRTASVYRANPLQADNLDDEEDDGSGGITVDVGNAGDNNEEGAHRAVLHPPACGPACRCVAAFCACVPWHTLNLHHPRTVVSLANRASPWWLATILPINVSATSAGTLRRWVIAIFCSSASYCPTK